MDADLHLKERQLEMIRCWPDTDHPRLMEYVESLWRMGDWGWKQQRNPYCPDTRPDLYATAPQ